MAKDGTINVYFHGSADGEASEENVGENQDGKNTTPKKNGKDLSRDAMITMGIGYAKKSLSYGVSVYGNLTGDYQSQRQMQSAIEGVGLLVMMTKFPIGTIAGAFSLATQTASSVIELVKSNRETAIIRERIGNEAVNNSESD